MTLEKARRLSLAVLLIYFTLLAALFAFSLIYGLNREEVRKREYLEATAAVLAPAVWGYYTDMAGALLDNYVLQDGHPYLEIRQNDGSVFYLHEADPPGMRLLYRLGVLKLRKMEIPILYQEIRIAEIRTEYVSSQTARGYLKAVIAVLAGLSGVLLRRVLIESITRSITLDELKTARDHLVVTDRIAYFSLLSMKLAHEFNTPLGIIITAQSFLSGRNGQYLDSPEGQEMLDMIGGAADRMKALIRRMQDSVPDTAGEEIQYVDVNEMVQGSVMGIRQDGDSFHINISSDEKWLTRPRALNLILDELLTNASVHGRNSAGRLFLSVTGTDSGEWKTIVIEDEGSGIPEELEDQVFSPFVTGRPIQTGPGLGLYLARIYAAQYLDGSLVYDTRREGGARFTVRFPAVNGV